MGRSEILKAIGAERLRQIEVERWTPEHDSKHHTQGELAMAACAYIAKPNITLDIGNSGIFITIKRDLFWPFNPNSYKPSFKENRIKELIKASALLVAEIERLKSENHG